MKKVLDQDYKLYINGQWVDVSDGETLNCYCPANGELLATCANASKEDVDSAVRAAWAAFTTWKETTPHDRAGYLLKVADLIDLHAEKLAMIDTLDNGKPIRDMLAVDLPLASDHFRYFASAIRTQEGQATMIDKDTMSHCCPVICY